MAVQVEVTAPVAYRVDELRADVRPLRALFETLALTLRHDFLNQGITAPLLEVALDLRYEGQDPIVTVPFLLDAEDAGVCLADPRPLDAQALREAVAQFQVAYTTEYGNISDPGPMQVVMLRVRTQAVQA